MKSLLVSIVAAVFLVGCGKSQSPEPPTAKAPDILIHDAALEGNIEAIKQHLAAGTDVNARGGIGETPLHSAAYYGHKVVAELLIAEGADVNAKTEDGVTPLDFAKRHPEIADLLRKHGGNDAWGPMPTKDEVANWPILETKTYKKELSPKSLKSQTRVFLLLQNNLNLDIDIIWLDFDGKPQSYGIIKAGEGRIINTFSTHRWLLKDKLYVTPEFSTRIKLHGKTGEELKAAEPVAEASQAEPPTAKAPDILIHDAVLRGNIEAVKQHLTAGMDVDARSKQDKTPLHLAAMVGHKEIAELLIAKGADVNAKGDLVGHTPLQVVATPLFIALIQRHKEVVELLIAKGADVNAKNRMGWTPLHFAASGRDKESAELLIAEGADVNAKDKNGTTPLDAPIRRKHPEIAELLRKHGGKTGEELKAEGK